MNTYLTEGGNASVTNKKTGENTRAEKIPIADIGRQEFIKKTLEMFHKLNSLFEKKFSEKLWTEEKHLADGFMFNGSTSFIMDPSLTDEEVLAVKKSAGDIDLAVPDRHKENLWKLLDELEGEEIIPGCTYMGSNRPTLSSVTDQINCVFIIDFPNNIRAKVQVDFELLPFGGVPDEWSKFSHSSSFDDAKAGVKAVAHKYAIRALASAASMRKDIVIATPASTADKYKLKKVPENDIPRMLKFSVTRGIRTAYEPLEDSDGNQIYDNGKAVYREKDSKTDKYETIVANIYGLVFNDEEKHPEDVKKFNSFVGVVDLMKKYLKKEAVDDMIFRFEQLLWDPKMGQELEVGDPKTDYEVKISAYNYLLKQLNKKMSSTTKKIIDEYYKGYGKRKSFISESTTFTDYINYLRG